jgi:hypothetical protein
MLESS